MNVDSIKNWIELVVLVLGWIISLVVAVNRLVEKINGVGSKVNALEVSVGQHETKLDNIETELQISVSDRKQLFREVGEFRSEVQALNKLCSDNDKKNNDLLTSIQVNIGKLDTKVDILLQERKL